MFLPFVICNCRPNNETRRSLWWIKCHILHRMGQEQFLEEDEGQGDGSCYCQQFEWLRKEAALDQRKDTQEELGCMVNAWSKFESHHHQACQAEFASRVQELTGLLGIFRCSLVGLQVFWYTVEQQYTGIEKDKDGEIQLLCFWLPPPLLLISLCCGMLSHFPLIHVFQKTRPDQLYVTDKTRPVANPQKENQFTNYVSLFSLFLSWKYKPNKGGKSS